MEEHLCPKCFKPSIRRCVWVIAPLFRVFPGAGILWFREICLANVKFTFIGLISFPKLKCLHSAESARTSFRFCLLSRRVCAWVVSVWVSMCLSNLLTYLGGYVNGVLECERGWGFWGEFWMPSSSRLNARLGKHLWNELTLSRKFVLLCGCPCVYLSACVSVHI